MTVSLSDRRVVRALWLGGFSLGWTLLVALPTLGGNHPYFGLVFNICTLGAAVAAVLLVRGTSPRLGSLAIAALTAAVAGAGIWSIIGGSGEASLLAQITLGPVMISGFLAATVQRWWAAALCGALAGALQIGLFVQLWRSSGIIVDY